MERVLGLTKHLEDILFVAAVMVPRDGHLWVRETFNVCRVAISFMGYNFRQDIVYPLLFGIEEFEHVQLRKALLPRHPPWPPRSGHDVRLSLRLSYYSFLASLLQSTSCTRYPRHRPVGH